MLNPRSVIDSFVKRFIEEKETDRAEDALKSLIGAFPTNVMVEQVLLKVISINTLYHARVLDVDLHPLAVAIHSIPDLDAKLSDGNLDVVNEIWRSEGTRRHYFSFATKFCSWHNQEAYAIYDRYMWQTLCRYRKDKSGFAFKDAECADYPGFHSVVKRFQTVYDLGDYSLKDIDKFLWLYGYQCLDS